MLTSASNPATNILIIYSSQKRFQRYDNTRTKWHIISNKFSNNFPINRSKSTVNLIELSSLYSIWKKEDPSKLIFQFAER